MLTANVFDRVAYLMDNAELDTCIGEYALYSIREAFQTVNAAYQYISGHLCSEERLEPLAGS